MSTWGKDVGRMFADTVELRRKRPWAYRVLTPLVLRATSEITPDALQDRVLVDKPYEGPNKPMYSRVERARREYHWGRGYDFEYFVMYSMLLGSLVLSQVVWWRQLSHAGHSPMFAAFAPPLVMLALPLSFAVCGYIYDFPELLSASLCLLLFVKRRWGLYYPLFALAVLNKETAVLWTVWCTALWWQGRSTFLRHVLAHALVGGIPFVAVRLWMAHLPGLGVEIHVLENLAYWTTPSHYFGFVDYYAKALPTPAPGNLVMIPLLGLLTFYAWRHKDRTVKTIFASSLAVFTPLYFIFGFENEVRVFTPCIPAFVVLAADTVRRLFAPELQARAYEAQLAPALGEPASAPLEVAFRTRPSDP
jgi:hypothetical protein